MHTDSTHDSAGLNCCHALGTGRCVGSGVSLSHSFGLSWTTTVEERMVQDPPHRAVGALTVFEGSFSKINATA